MSTSLLLGFLCCLSYAVYEATFVQISKNPIKKMWGIFGRILLVALFSGILGVVFTPEKFQFEVLYCIPIFVAITGGAFFFYGNALSESEGNVATPIAIKNMESLAISILGFLFFGEKLTFLEAGILFGILSCGLVLSLNGFQNLVTKLQGGNLVLPPYAQKTWVAAVLSGFAYTLVAGFLADKLGVGPFWAMFSSCTGGAFFFGFKILKDWETQKQILPQLNRQDYFFILVCGISATAGANLFAAGTINGSISLMSIFLAADVPLALAIQAIFFGTPTPLWKMLPITITTFLLILLNLI
jgi:drug/metabolite transporter (DMT)-like permease